MTMLCKRLVSFLLMSIMTWLCKDMAAAKFFEKTQYPNGTVTCALDEPSLVIPLDRLSNGDACVAPGALCALQCVQDSDCTNYNYRNDPRTCEIYHYTPRNCSAVIGCYHAEVTDLHSCQSAEETSTMVAVASDLSHGHSFLSSKESTGMPTLSMTTKNTTSSSNPVPSKDELNHCLSTSFLTVSSSMSSPKHSTTFSTTTASPTSTKYVQSTTTVITIAPPPTIAIGTLCDAVLASPNYVMQVNQGFGLDQNWQAYKYGFSDSNGGYWLGNENMYKMTNNGYQWNLCADVKDELGIQYYVLYTTYIMDAESAGYTYYLSGMIGAPIDAMGPDNRKYKFTTKDKNNQPCCCANQATACKGGWWYSCSIGGQMVILNGVGSSGFKYSLGPGTTIQVKRSYIRISQP